MFQKDHKEKRWKRTLLLSALSVAGIVVLVVILATQVHGFLTVQELVDSDTIIVSGTTSDSALEQIVADVGPRRNVQYLTVGGPITRGSHLSPYRDYAHLAAATLLKLGVSSSDVIAIPAPKSDRDRVFAAALALRDWLAYSNIEINSINVYTVGVRGRRTLILFREALGPDVNVGIISIVDDDYDPSVWWTTSEGFRTVVSELIAYLYVKTIFRLKQ